MFIPRKQHSYDEDIKVSAFYSLMTSTQFRKVAREAIDQGWGKQFNEQDPEDKASLLVDFLGGFSDLLVEQEGLSEVNHQTYRRGTDEESPWEEIALKLMDKGANAWVATKDLPFFLTENRYGGRDKEEKPDFTVEVDGFDQAVHTGFTKVMERAFEHPECPATKDLEKRFTIYYGSRYHQTAGHRVPYLHAAVANERLKTAGMLLEHGFSLEQKDEKGRTPLFYANTIETVDWLLKKGSNPATKDNEKKLPSLVWRKRLHPTVANPMIRRYQEALLGRIGELDKEDRMDLVRQRAQEVLDKGQQRALVQLAKAAEIDLKELTFPSEKTGREQSLLYLASLSLLAKDSLSINGITLGLKLEQGLHESVAGIPDAFWAQQALDNKSNQSENGLKESLDLVEQIVKQYKQKHPEIGAMSNERLLAVWATMGAMDGTNPMITALGSNVSDLGLRLTEQEQKDLSQGGIYNFNGEPLYLQYLCPLIEQKRVQPETVLSKLETIKDPEGRNKLLNSPLFWKALTHYKRNGNYFWSQPTLEMWKYIQSSGFEPDLGKISQADLEKLLEPDGVTKLNDSDSAIEQMARSWLQRWSLKETEREVILAQGGQEQMSLPLKMKRRI